MTHCCVKREGQNCIQPYRMIKTAKKERSYTYMNHLEGNIWTRIILGNFPPHF